MKLNEILSSLPNQIKIQQEKIKENLLENDKFRGKINVINLDIDKNNKLIEEIKENINILKKEISLSNKEKIQFELNLQELLKNIEKINHKNSLVNIFFYYFYL